MTASSDDLNERALALFEQSLDIGSDDREDWIIQTAASDSALRDKALSYLSRDANRNAAFQTGGAFHETLDDTAVPAQIGAYKITGLIGRGGMGAVYRGERVSGDFDHDVAIKVVRPGAMSDKLVRRFEDERQTLAKLSHPHIARLYDGGTLANGAPYIVMEHIEGMPITEWVIQKNLPDEDRLNLFCAACAAVSHAHQNLIVHRDITPSNVLVNVQGQVKLIDFGIAKPFDQDANPTVLGHSLESLTFTPGFAAPERSSGAGANTLSDIYSMGKLLSALPEHRTSSELNAICSKATSANPEERYETVQALADDVQNYIHKFPVDARHASSRYKFQKFLSRHKVGSVLATGSILALLAAFGFTLFQYNQAETARVDADRRFNDVRTLATSMITDIHAEIYRVPGSTKASKKLVEVAQTYLDDLANSPNAPDPVKLEAAIGYTKLGSIVAGTKGGSIEDLDTADKYFSQAKTLLDALETSDSQNTDTLFALGKLYFYMSEISIEPRQKYDLAREQLQNSKSYLERAIDISPNNVEFQISWMHSNCISAETLIAQGQSEEAQRILRECIVYANKLLSENPNNENILRVKSASSRTLANALSTDGKFSDAIPVLNEAIADLEIIKTLVDEENDNFTLRALTMAYWRRGYAHANIESYEASIADYNLALDYTNTRLEKDPEDKDATWFYFTIKAELATPLQSLGRNEDAEAGLIAALNWYQGRHREKPENSSRLGNLFVHHYMMGDFYKKIKNQLKECDSYEKSYGFFKLIDEIGTISSWHTETLSGMKKAADFCEIDFKH